MLVLQGFESGDMCILVNLAGWRGIVGKAVGISEGHSEVEYRKWVVLA